ncbi:MULTISPECIES: HIT family protein [unclassified Breznakia]|uniref:HIT family protein n=1 Tax=unclassified Breznakia TaxID=2623764 RepID=UPI002475FB7C|nr:MULTISPECIES: HIT family protein [unclassified Breznakia]MDH6367775.1 histidine triad (HIT) family protein [Breznakia sp. PH1-1]MDH6404871.1 histidine triad (HIT) family protein [Breznakia sp. PF1-11]MDH6412586.1 histidine triad (HIT) family protein [Breznakia sp. PFB1-11]MDH6414938.1 histidine triad (HIT) family protein [Breznakia sp. PFB1-14]MDH6417249.1 histidine triad (HIT) family protein [Breznakia sp. PFB1-4]
MCIFCKIVDGKIPSYKVYEDSDVLAFLDISQVTKGHTLVIPKKHYENFIDVEPEILQKVMAVAQDLAKDYMDKLSCTGMNILSNVNEVAGQSVFHFHVHLIPRYAKNDDVVIEFKQSPEQDLPALQQLLKKD